MSQREKNLAELIEIMDRGLPKVKAAILDRDWDRAEGCLADHIQTLSAGLSLVRELKHEGEQQ